MTASGAQSAEMRAVLTRAAAEAERQRARQAGGWPAVAGLERELAALWRRHSELKGLAQADERKGMGERTYSLSRSGP